MNDADLESFVVLKYGRPQKNFTIWFIHQLPNEFREMHGYTGSNWILSTANQTPQSIVEQLIEYERTQQST